MKYKDTHTTIETPNLVIYDTDRPTPCFIDLFNPPGNTLTAQGINIISRCFAVLANNKNNISLGVADKRLHCVIPALSYMRNNKEDKYFTVHNHLTIRENDLSRELVQSNLPRFLENSRQIVDEMFQSPNFKYLIFSLEDKETIATGIDYINKHRGIVSVHNPAYHNLTFLTKYILEKDLVPSENSDGSLDVICL